MSHLFEPSPDCSLCPRLVGVRGELRVTHPEWHNAPVNAFGDADGWLAIVGTAPVREGGNRTGRPFSGDAVGASLYRILGECGLVGGACDMGADDDTGVRGALLVDAVRCTAPGNRPASAEVHACRPFLTGTLRAMGNLRVVLALGEVAHQSAVKALGGKLPKIRFAHGSVHRLHTGYVLIDSQHPAGFDRKTRESMLQEIMALVMSESPSGE